MKSVMRDSLALKGLLLDDVIYIKGKGYNPYKVTSQGLVDCNDVLSYKETVDVLNGEVEWQEIPYVIELGDYYWRINIMGKAIKAPFLGSMEDYAFRYCGNWFRTEEACNRGAKKVKKLLEVGVIK